MKLNRNTHPQNNKTFFIFQSIIKTEQLAERTKEDVQQSLFALFSVGDGLTAQQKLIVLGGSFLVDLNYFEKQNKCW